MTKPPLREGLVFEMLRGGDWRYLKIVRCHIFSGYKVVDQAGRASVPELDIDITLGEIYEWLLEQHNSGNTVRRIGSGHADYYAANRASEYSGTVSTDRGISHIFPPDAVYVSTPTTTWTDSRGEQLAGGSDESCRSCGINPDDCDCP